MADVVALIPGVGTFVMEAVARQIAVDKGVMVLRNGWLAGFPSVSCKSLRRIAVLQVKL